MLIYQRPHFRLALAEPAGLLCYVVAQHCSEHEILLGSEQVQRFVDEARDCVEACAFAEEQVDVAVAEFMCQEADTLIVQPFFYYLGACGAQCAQYQAANPLFELVDQLRDHFYLPDAGIFIR